MKDELVTLKKEKDRLERELAHKNEQLLNFKTDLEKSAVALKNAELKITTLKAQVKYNLHITSFLVFLHHDQSDVVDIPYAGCPGLLLVSVSSVL